MMMTYLMRRGILVNCTLYCRFWNELTHSGRANYLELNARSVFAVWAMVEWIRENNEAYCM